MQDLIRLLPDAIANQIAAGEVVQRPASVVKELMENALDAQAKRIQLIVKDAGKQSIQVIDDGKGMSPGDARQCFERHATSKIQQAADLFRIQTMGFRGEALASIASVAQVELKTRPQDAELGTLVRMEGSVLKTQEACTCPVGTSVLVKNLFYNVPARRNFLKSNPVEMRHILDEFTRLALAHPDLEFSLIQGEEETMRLPADKLGKRIVDLFGKHYREQLAACEEETSYVSIKGYVGKPENAKKSRGEQFLFVNNRYIKNPYVHHAIVQAYERLLPEGYHPFYVLFLSIDPQHIDINVHPTKTEIKFDDERSIYAIVQAAVRKCLSTHHLIPSIDFNTNINFLDQLKEASSSKDAQAHPHMEAYKTKPVQEAWKSLYAGLQEQIQQFESQKPETGVLFEPESAVLGSRANARLEEGVHAKQWQILPFLQKYIALSRPDGLLLVDQQRAFQRIWFDQFSQRVQQGAGQSQQLLFPEIIHLSPVDAALFSENQTLFQQLGFDFQALEPQQWQINGIPAELKEEASAALIEGMLEDLKEDRNLSYLPKKEKMMVTLAKRAAQRASVQSQQPEEIGHLIERLFASSNPNYSPDGGNICRLLRQEEIQELLGF